MRETLEAIRHYFFRNAEQNYQGISLKYGHTHFKTFYVISEQTSSSHVWSTVIQLLMLGNILLHYRFTLKADTS